MNCYDYTRFSGIEYINIGRKTEMKREDALAYYKKEVDAIKEAGLFKGEKLITSPQGAKVKLEDGRELLNMCANN